MQSISYKLYSKYVDKNGETSLHFLVTIDRKLVYLNLKFKIPAVDFDKENGRYIGKNTDIKNIIAMAEGKLSKIILRHRALEITLNKETLLFEFSQEGAKIKFVDYIENQLNKEVLLEDSTIKTIKQTISHLKKYDKNLYLGDIDNEFYDDFEKYMCDNKLSFNTRNKHHKYVKKYLDKAVRQKKILYSPYMDVKIKRAAGQRFPLKQDQLKRLVDMYYHELDNYPHLKNSLALYLSSCLFGGMRFSDAVRLSEKNLFNNKIIFEPQKTKRFNRKIQIPLGSEGVKLFKEIMKNKVYHISNSKINQNLKKIAYMADIDINLTFHTARYTFGTLFLQTNGELMTLMDIMGISKIETAKIYVKLLDEFKENKINNYLAGFV